jgi:signal transduction histidine kinase
MSVEQPDRSMSARFGELEGAHRRLRHLYDISKVLTRLQDVERSVPEVLAMIGRSMSILNAICLLKKPVSKRTFAWRAEGESAERLERAQELANETFAYLVPDHSRQRRASQPSGESLAAVEGSPPAASPNVIHLPLVVEHGAAFGSLRIEGHGTFDEQDLLFLSTVVNQLAIAIDRQDVSEGRRRIAEENEREQRLLGRVGTAVASSLDHRETLDALASCIVPDLADICFIDELGEAGGIERQVVLFADRDKQAQLGETLKVSMSAPAPGPQAEVLESGQPTLLAEIEDPLAAGLAEVDSTAEMMQAAGVQSMMVLPLKARGTMLGTMTIAMADSGRSYSSHDFAVAREIAHRASLGLNNARLYEKAQHATRSRAELLSIVSHDLKNPLASILIVSASLQRQLADQGDQRVRTGLARIERGAQRMNRLIEDLLDSAAIEAGAISVAPRPHAVAPLVTEAVGAAQPLADSKSLSLGVELSADLPPVLADPTRIQQVLGNLLGNALKFTPEGGSVVVRAESSGELVTFSVTDTGPGIPADELPHLFGRFRRVRGEEKPGTGLGLFISNGIVRGHGGTLWVTSTVGQGSTFSFTLPVAPP